MVEKLTEKDAKDVVKSHFGKLYDLKPEAWQDTKRNEPFDLIFELNGEKHFIEIKSSSKPFLKAFGAVSHKELIISLQEKNYLFVFVSLEENGKPSIHIFPPELLFYVISDLYIYPKFRNKRKSMINYDEKGGMFFATKESNKDKIEFGKNEFVKNIDKLKEILDKQLKEKLL